MLIFGMLAALIVSSVAAPFILKMLVAMKSRQNVSQHLEQHAHKQGTPTMGGIIVLVGVLAGMAVTWQPTYLAPLVLILGFGAVGFLDDYLVPRMKPGSRGLSWLPKLGLEIGASVVAAFFMGLTSPVMIGVFVFMTLFLSNAYNFSDGLDTLAGGLGMILAGGFLIVSALPSFSYSPGDNLVAEHLIANTFVALFLILGFIPFMFLNAAPAKVFMGDVGSLPIGALFAWMSMPLIKLGVPSAQGRPGPVVWLALILMFLVMLVEIVPVPLQIGWVKLTKKRMFNFKTPVHHAFQDLGWPETRIAMAFHLTQIALVIVAVGLVISNQGLVRSN